MIQSSMKISVIIPVYNGEKYIKQAIDSILAQTYKPLEVVIIDDGSEDDTRQAVSDYGNDIVYFYQENRGIAAARNRGISESRGEYICFLDSDDIWVRQKLEIQKTALQKDDSSDMVFGMIKQFYSPDTGAAFRQRVRCPPGPMEGVHPGTMLISKEALLDVGMFSTAYRTGEFIEWKARAMEKGLKAYCIPEVLLYRRIHEGNYTLKNKQSRQDYARIIRDMMLRRKNITDEKK